MKTIRIAIKVTLDVNGDPDLSGYPFSLQFKKKWFENAFSATSPVTFTDPLGNTVTKDVEVYDTVFTWYAYQVDGHVSNNNAVPIFSFVKTREDGTGWLFMCVSQQLDENGNVVFRDDCDDVYDQFIKSVSVLSDSVMTENEKFIYIA